jgi:hypothetical protein
MDLNHDKQIQSLLCYRYTIGQDGRIRLNILRIESRIVEALKRLCVEAVSAIRAAYSALTLRRFNALTF